MSANTKPIGVFDSGIGGLTVFEALSRRMPEENLIYFGDTAHVPYGSKSQAAVTRYSLAIARFLVSRRIKLLVVACNTASALALGRLKDKLKIPVIGVIAPGARAAVAVTGRKRVAVIGTEATINSGAYLKALRALAPGIQAQGIACPLFVPLVEEGWWEHPVTAKIAREYLEALRGSRVDTLILGCTHYPLLKKTIGTIVGPSIRLIDSAEETARETQDALNRLALRRQGGRGKRQFFVSDAPRRFLRIARLLGVKVSQVRLHPVDV